MNKTAYKIGRFFYKKYPSLQQLIRSAYIRFFAKLNFIGWGMATEHATPWDDEVDWKDFRNTCEHIKTSFDLAPDAPSTPVNLDDLKWRHWVVSYATRKALLFCKTTDHHFVECGTGDGLTTYFILQEMKTRHKIDKCMLHLYDAWQSMEKQNLVEGEKHYEGKYHDLSLARTKKNLSEFVANTRFNVGFITDTLNADAPQQISFLHIDLNSSKPTLAALEFFLPRLSENGVVLFDDYGDFIHRQTKIVVDEFFRNKPGIIEKLPTGQAIYYHRVIG